MYSNYYKVMGFCVMLFEMKHRQTKSEEAAGEQRAPSSHSSARCNPYTGNAHIHWEWGQSLRAQDCQSHTRQCGLSITLGTHQASERCNLQFQREKSFSAIICRVWQGWIMSPATCVIEATTDKKQGNKGQLIPARHLESHAKLLGTF